ncbi:hypothetical protein [Marinitenerispora sediminis]|uniref:Guanylate cyclase domain-containing protein n=1 Tax=Marinitenerispora sediminis TaxID=1931232 RepID=A0A368TBK5_9ACTN|nr:hypothetical protein [Marinitenerispora sediminis]RCV58152.1 hypothetical protein DEF28_00325 [Marinitenerispora sediminis]RCV61443.1 hypothetical protein DEF23_02140 [Marinitenerispora sediminis]RCV62523.1 hypothetical protein DEF24_00675 [Marinitenerispora sediminis]
MNDILRFERRAPRVSVPLPPYQAVLAVDIVKYTRNPDLDQQILSRAVPRILEVAFQRSNLADVWANRRFPQAAGDSYVIGAEPRNLPFLIHPLLGCLQETLEDARSQLAAHDRNLRLRLRASIDVGPLPEASEGGAPDGIGGAMNHTHRLLDSDPVRDELDNADPDATLLAAIVSRRVYEDAVLGGFVGVPPSRFRAVHVDMPAKEFDAEGYLYIPFPTWRADAKSSGRVASDESEPAPATETGVAPSSGAGGNHNSGNAQQVIQGQTFQGGITWNGEQK